MNKDLIMNKAIELNEALKESAEYKAYLEAQTKVKGHSAADIMVSDFRKKQIQVQKNAMEGKDVENDLKELQKLWEIISINPYVRSVIEAELSFGQLYGEVMQTVAKGIEILDNNGKDEGVRE